MNLLDTTIRLLNASDKTLQQIANDTGLKQRWLYNLAAGKMKDPGVTKIELLHNYLVTQQDCAA